MPLLPPVAALIDVPSGALLTCSLRAPTIAFLAKSEPEVRVWWGVNYPHYTKSFPIGDASPQHYPEWTWVPTKRQFDPTPPELITDRVLAASALATRKRDAVWEVMLGISNVRSHLNTGIFLQESVHLTKSAQARAFLAASFGQPDPLNYPYVLQYADMMGIPMREAADEILFKAQCDDDILARSEAIRLKYFGLLKTAQLDTIHALMVTFRQAIR